MLRRATSVGGVKNKTRKNRLSIMKRELEGKRKAEKKDGRSVRRGKGWYS